LLLSIKNFKKVKPARGPSPVVFLAICLLLILATGCSINPPAPEISGSIEGNVFEPTSPVTQGMVPLSGALASVSNTSNTVLTDVLGYFRIDEIPVGEQTVTISKEGYVSLILENVPLLKERLLYSAGRAKTP